MEIVDAFPERFKRNKYSEFADGKIRKLTKGADYKNVDSISTQLYAAARRCGMKAKIHKDGEDALYVQFKPRARQKQK